MFKPDAIVAWPSHLDYPLWRQFIRDNRTRFTKVIVVFTKMNVPSPDYRQFIQDAMAIDGITFLENDSVAGDQDWRNVAMNKALLWATNQWIWFTEQDFLIFKPEKFWPGIADCADLGSDVMVYWQGNSRFHPCCFFIKKWILENFTSKDFGVIPDKGDHFIKIEKELESPKSAAVTIFKITSEARMDWFDHMNGLSQNMYMLQLGQKPNYDYKRFRKYLKNCLGVSVPMHPEFEAMIRRCLGG